MNEFYVTLNAYDILQMDHNGMYRYHCGCETISPATNEQLRATCLVSTSCVARCSRTSTCHRPHSPHRAPSNLYPSTHAGSRTPYQYTTRSPTLHPPPQLHYNHLPPSPAPQYIQFIREPPRPSPAMRRDFSASPLAAVEAANLRRGNSQRQSSI